MQRRFLNDDELRDAQKLVGWQFWIGPISSTLVFLACGWYAGQEEDLRTKYLGLGILGILFAPFWVVRAWQYKKFAVDIQARAVDVVQGAPERVRLSRMGRCYVRVEGRDICVPNEHYKELQDANAAKIEFLPESRLATKVTVIRGMGIGV